jgi:type IV fimbrial biogenesis protein FimT
MMVLLSFARSEAVSTGHTVTFCSSTDGIECSHGTTNWLLIFFDRNNNQQAEPNETLRRETPYASNIRYILKVSAHRTYLRFRPEGTALEPGSLTLCTKNNDNSLAAQLIINFGGRVRVAQDSDHDGTPEDSEGNPVDCSSLTS